MASNTTVSTTSTEQLTDDVAVPINLESLPNQTGTAIVNARECVSSLLSTEEEKSSSILTNHIQSITGNISEKDVGIILKMLLQVGTFLSSASKGINDDDDNVDESLERMCIDFPNFRYNCCLVDDGNLYIVKQTV